MPAPKQNENTRSPIQLIAVDNIQVDHGVQSRVKLNKDFAKEFMEAMRRGEVFPPVDVFWDNKRWWLADGFHRHDAAKNGGFKDILCRIHYGTRRDAIIFSAGANQHFSVKRSKEDVERAVTLLLEDDEWFHKSDSAISKYVGCNDQVVRRIRIGFCDEHEIPVPQWREDVEGNYKAAKQSRKTNFKKRKIQQKKDGSFRASVLGREVNLGRNREKAQDKLDAMSSKIALDKLVLNPDRLPYFFLREGIVLDGTPNLGAFRGIGKTFHNERVVVVTADLARPDEIYRAVGRLFMLREYFGKRRRMVCLCVVADGISTQVDLARRLGVEFMTAKELADSLKPASM